MFGERRSSRDTVQIKELVEKSKDLDEIISKMNRDIETIKDSIKAANQSLSDKAM